MQLIPNRDDIGTRIDAYITQQNSDWTRSMVQKWIAEGNLLLDGVPVKKNYRIEGNETFQLHAPALIPLEVQPQAIPLDIVFEDNDIIVINKPKGMVVHPAAGNWDGTLVNALLAHCGSSLSGINGVIRPGIVHRIDKDTSGLLVVAKNDFAHQSLAAQIASHDARREYEAIVIGTPRDAEGVIDKPIARHSNNRRKMAIMADGKPAVTEYTLLRQYAGYAHMRFRLQTGRTHQIRVHMASIGHPIIGDYVYGLKSDRFTTKLDGQCLHAVQLALTHPRTEQRMVFDAPLPQYFMEVLQKLERESL